MNFPDAMTAIVSGSAVRRAAWKPRKAIRLMVEPWGGASDKILVCDAGGQIRVAYAYTAPGEDVRADDWETIEIKEVEST